MISEDRAHLVVAAGVVLEGWIAVPATPSGGVVVCHPHPLYGGDMDNPVVVRVAEVCQALGLATLRFNFRGVGGSTGLHDQGHGEQDDASTALDRLAALIEGAPLAIAGYSFGASVAAAIARHRQGLAGVVLIAPPLGMPGFGDVAALGTIRAPLLVVAGSADEHCPPEALDRARRAAPEATVTLIEGANHFFLGKLFPLGETVAKWAQRHVRRKPA